MNLPEGYLEERLAKASETYFFGTPITELTHDELLACMVEASNMIQSMQEDRLRQARMQALFAEARETASHFTPRRG